MPPIVVVKTPGTRTKRRRKGENAGSISDTEARILLPELPSLERVPLPVALSAPSEHPTRTTFNRFKVPIPVVYDSYPEIVYGGAIHPSHCDVYPSTTPPAFGLQEGIEVEAAMCDVPEAHAPVVYIGTDVHTSQADPEPPLVSFSRGRLEHDEGDQGILDFDFQGGLSPNARLQARFFATREDAELGINPLSEDETPSDVVLRTSEALTQRGRHPGTITFRSHDVGVRTTIFGRVDVIYSDHTHSDPVPPSPRIPIPEPDPTTPGTDVPRVYPDVYPSTVPPVFGDVIGTPIDPEVCPPTMDPPNPISQVYGGEVYPALCDEDMEHMNVYGTGISAVYCDVYPTAPP